MIAVHAVIYALALFGAVAVVAQVPRARASLHARRHDAVMARIAKLEVETGLGVDYAADWLNAQKPDWVNDRQRELRMIGKLRCRLCKTTFERNGASVEVIMLCPECRRR